MKAWAVKFYNSKEWKQLRNAYFKSQHGICERCGKAGLEVHHKEWLTPKNISNPDVSLNWDKLELLCFDCHKEEHRTTKACMQEDVMMDDYGDIVQRI